ncbi:MAG: hypothetical protein ACK5HY_06700 [Parahaliea sp.]
MLLFKDKYVYRDGAIREMMIWRLPASDPERAHGLKYRLYHAHAERRLDILGTLRQLGPLSARALATTLQRNYKNVHVDTRALEQAGLLERSESGTLQASWDVIDAHLSLVT